MDNRHLGEVEEEDFDEYDDPMICDTCKKPLAIVRKPEYPGGYAWPYCYCSNPDCKEYGKEQ